MTCSRSRGRGYQLYQASVKSEIAEAVLISKVQLTELKADINLEEFFSNVFVLSLSYHSLFSSRFLAGYGCYSREARAFGRRLHSLRGVSLL